jgi:hypothetical protein
MTVQECWVGGRVHTVSGVGYAPDGAVTDAAGVATLLREAAGRPAAAAESQPRRCAVRSGWSPPIKDFGLPDR